MSRTTRARALLLLSTLLVGCRPPEDETTSSKEKTPVDTADTDTDTPTTPTGETGTETTDTGPTIDPDCLVPPPPGPFSHTASSVIQTEEDFDFDAEGFLLTQANTSLRATNRNGQSHIVAPNIGVDAAGVRSLVTGDVVVAQPDTGALRLVNYATGGSSIIMGGVRFPNGLEASEDGMVFSSEFVANGRIRLIEPYSGDSTVIAQMDFPNNMALSPDGNRLYVAATTGSYGGSGRIALIERDEFGQWGEPSVFYTHPAMLGGITTDKCGNVYAVDFSGGTVFRILADGTGPELIANLSGGWSFSSLRFGSGIGDWGRTELFATNRSQLFVMDVGIEGRHVLAQ